MRTTDPATILVESVFGYAISVIDKQFGEGYARRHPELIVGFIQAHAIEEVGIELGRIGEILALDVGGSCPHPRVWVAAAYQAMKGNPTDAREASETE